MQMKRIFAFLLVTYLEFKLGVLKSLCNICMQTFILRTFFLNMKPPTMTLKYGIPMKKQQELEIRLYT